MYAYMYDVRRYRTLWRELDPLSLSLSLSLSVFVCLCLDLCLWLSLCLSLSLYLCLSLSHSLFGELGTPSSKYQILGWCNSCCARTRSSLVNSKKSPIFPKKEPCITRVVYNLKRNIDIRERNVHVRSKCHAWCGTLCARHAGTRTSLVNSKKSPVYLEKNPIYPQMRRKWYHVLRCPSSSANSGKNSVCPEKYPTYQVHISYTSATYQVHISYISGTYQLHISTKALYIRQKHVNICERKANSSWTQLVSGR